MSSSIGCYPNVASPFDWRDHVTNCRVFAKALDGFRLVESIRVQSLVAIAREVPDESVYGCRRGAVFGHTLLL